MSDRLMEGFDEVEGSSANSANGPSEPEIYRLTVEIQSDCRLSISAGFQQPVLKRACRGRQGSGLGDNEVIGEGRAKGPVEWIDQITTVKF